MFNIFYPTTPPAGTYPLQSQEAYLSSPQYHHQYQQQYQHQYRGSYYLPTPYPQEPYPPQQTYAEPDSTQQHQPTTGHEHAGPSYLPQYFPPQQRSSQPVPPQAGDFLSQPSEKSWNPEQSWNEYKHTPDPQHSNLENRRGQREDQLSVGHSAQQQEGTEGERGLGATVLGGVAGAFFGHKALKNHGTLGAIGGLVLGAVAANAFEHHEKEKNERKEHRREERDFDKGTRGNIIITIIGMRIMMMATMIVNMTTGRRLILSEKITDVLAFDVSA